MHKFQEKQIAFIALLLFAFTFSVKAQINHFVYLQTDNKQSFYIKYNSKIYSSTSSGYLILSKLSEGLINFTIGFPQSQIQEQKFELQIGKTEKGFLLKNFNEKGWGLFDLQSSNVTYAVTSQTPLILTGNNTVNNPLANDPFANMLSTVTQDSTVKNVIVKKEEKIVVDSPKPIVQQVVQPTIPAASPQKNDTAKTVVVIQSEVPPVIPEPQWVSPAKSAITKPRSLQSKEGSDIIYVVKNENGILDTVRLFIPVDSNQLQVITPVINEPIIQKDTISLVPVIKTESPAQPEVKKEAQNNIENPKIKPVESKEEIKTVPNSNCTNQATEDDFIKLRRKMAGQSKDEAMVNEAKKVFKTICFSTAQLKNLSVLFLSDEWRYRFYDAALPFVNDFSNFKILEETIMDEYYKKRFQALLPNQ